jgi:hypothetical protein
MRAKEFITEKKKGKMSKTHQQATRGLHTFQDSTYDLNRVMMAVAASDGTSPVDMDSQSWIGNKVNTSHPYSQIEQDMLKQAYKALGLKFTDLNKGDLKSGELDSTNTKSTLKPFKGYKK